MGTLRESENGLIKPYGAKTQHVQRDGHWQMSKILKNGVIPQKCLEMKRIRAMFG
jgi:hypothetical protein